MRPVPCRRLFPRIPSKELVRSGRDATGVDGRRTRSSRPYNSGRGRQCNWCGQGGAAPSGSRDAIKDRSSRTTLTWRPGSTSTTTSSAPRASNDASTHGEMTQAEAFVQTEQTETPVSSTSTSTHDPVPMLPELPEESCTKVKTPPPPTSLPRNSST